MKLIFATWAPVEYQGHVLTEMGARRRLVSYFDLRDRPMGILREYLDKGKVGKPSNGKVRK
jgi:hypothetical protein